MNTPPKKAQHGKPHPGHEKITLGKAQTGIIRTTGKGMGFVRLPDREDEIVIEAPFVNTALNGDEVEIQITGKYFDVKRGRPGQRTSREEGSFTQQAGQVVRVVKRARKQFVGTLMHQDGHVWMKPDDRRIYVTFLIPPSEFAASTDLLLKRENKTGLKVLVRIAAWNKNEAFPTGSIIQVLGERGDHETEMQSIILDRGINTTFPPEVDA
jgi:exoribonuclease R